MSPEAKERRLPRPRIEEFSQLDPLRIGETLGWENTEFPQTKGLTCWHFAGPISLLVTRRTREDGTVFGLVDAIKIVNSKIVAQAILDNFSEVEFNKTKKEVTFITIGKKPLTIRSTGQVDGTADVHIAPPRD